MSGSSDVVVFCFVLPAPLLTRTVDRRLASVLVALVWLAEVVAEAGAVMAALRWSPDQPVGAGAR